MKRHAVLTSTFTNVLDLSGTLQARALQGAHPAPLKRVAQGVAVALVGALCLPMSPASSGSIDAIEPKHYIRLLLNDPQAKCLITLYSKESAFNPSAVGNLKGKYHTYGIPQIKNALIAGLTPNRQIDYGIKYINHRYHGDACVALHHFKIRGWH